MLNSPVWRGRSQYAFAAGLAAGGVSSALALVVVGSLLRVVAPEWVWAVLAAVVFVVMAVREIGLVSFPMPQNARLVPESVFRHGRFWGPFEFGLEMGTGVRTYVTSGLPYVLIVVLAFFASPLTAVSAGVAFGLGRALMTFATIGFDPDGGWGLAFDRHQRVVRTVLLGGFAVALAAVLL